MRSLLIRIFASFWSIILITIIVAVAIGYSYAERSRISMQNFETSDVLLGAGAALRENGRQGLTEWLRSLPDNLEYQIYVVDERGQDLLDRRLPSAFKQTMRRLRNPGSRLLRSRRDQPNLRPARPFTQLIGPDDRHYTIFLRGPQNAGTRWFAERGLAALIVLALLVSAAVSFLLARTISQPIRRLRESANAIAKGQLDARVSEGVVKRRDELGLLATDFDRMAGELQRAWGKQTELTRNVSHELRSPLARLRVALELARRKTGDLSELDRIETETERLDVLIGRILEYSRLDAGQGEAKTRIDLGDLAQSVVDDVRYEFGELGSSASIEFTVEENPHIDGYPNALRSCIENVLRNAMAHGQADANVTIRLTTKVDQPLITIEDQGGGVPDDELGQIFEPFYRSRVASGIRSTKTGGLGLAIAARAIALHNGTINATNSQGGLRVSISLPAIR